MRNIIFPVIFIILFSISCQINAQAYQPGRKGLTQNWRVNLNAGSSTFYGDIKDAGIFPYDIDYKIGYGILIRKQLTPVFGLGGQVYNTKLKSTQKYIDEGIEKAITFDADVFEYNLHLLLDFTNLFSAYSPERKINAFFFLGLGLSNWKTIVSNYPDGGTIRANGFTGKGPGKRTTELVMPMGIGVRYNINNKFALNFETSLHPVNSDLLDATSGDFSYDMIHYTNLGITFFLNSNSSDQDRSREVIRIKKKQSRRKSKGMNTYKEPSNYEYSELQKSEPVDQKEIKMEQKQDISDFKKKYAETDLPVVSEYNIKGVFGRESHRIASPQVSSSLPELQIREATNPEAAKSSKTITFKQRQLKNNEESAPENAEQPNIVFGVQILAAKSSTDIHPLLKKYHISEEVKEYHDNGWIRYVVVSFPNLQSAVTYSEILHERGLKDAFVVTYKNGRRINPGS